MKMYLFLGVMAALALMGGYVVAEKAAEEDEEAVTWEQLPAAVQAALPQLVGDVKNASFACEKEDGFLMYEAAYETQSGAQEVKLTPDGILVEREQKVSDDALPTAVAKSIADAFPGGKIAGAEHIDLVFYEVKIETEGNKGAKEIRILPNGQRLEIE